MKKRLYLANPYGFSKQNKKLLSEFIEIFSNLNIDVYEPFERTKHLIKEEGYCAFNIAKANYDDLRKSDCIFAIVNGTPPDEGVMIELGIATALNKKIFLFRDDFRKCSDSYEYPLNLMIFLGLPKENWQRFYIESIEEITSNKKEFLKWAKT